MEYTTIYEKTNTIPREAAKFYLEKYTLLLKWKPTEKVIDIGCGDGGVTLEILLPKIPQTFLNLTGIDISKQAVSIAKQKTKDTRINFFVFDISSSTLPVSLANSFDHVFALYCLHWVYKQKTALNNIFDILKPGGEAVLTYVVNAPMYPVQKIMATSEKWRQYIPNVQQYLPPFLDSEDPIFELKELLSDAGFTCQDLSLHKKVTVFEDKNTFKTFLITVNQFVKFIPDENKNEYINEYIQKTMEDSEHIEIASDNKTLYFHHIDMAAYVQTPVEKKTKMVLQVEPQNIAN